MLIPHHFNVMPVKDKKPLIRWIDITDREQTAEEKAKILENGEIGNIGIVCGAVSRIFVLDIDGPKGEESIAKYHLPRTPSVKTPHGRHIYFRWTKELEDKVTTKTAILEGVDVRGNGGYVVFYGWELGPHLSGFAWPPKWLVDLLPDKGGLRLVTSGPAAILSAIKEGNRNDSFTRLAGSLWGKGYSVDVVYGMLSASAREAQFPESELLAICKSVSRYPQPLTMTTDGQGENIESFLADRVNVKWICEPFIAEQSIGIIAGLPESRKSWIMVDLAVTAAAGGGQWMSRFPVAKKRVLLIDQERTKSEVQRRIQAVIAGKGLAVNDIRDTLFVRSSTSTRMDDQRSYDSLKKEINDIKPELILIDSFATIHTKNESSRMEIQQVMERFKELRNEFKCSIVIIHHETKASFQGKKEGAESSFLDMAGNIAIPAAAEFCMNVTKHTEEASWCHHTKSTQGNKMAPFLVKVRDAVPDKSQIIVEAF